jgi:hypothetical protein
MNAPKELSRADRDVRRRFTLHTPGDPQAEQQGLARLKLAERIARRKRKR